MHFLYPFFILLFLFSSCQVYYSGSYLTNQNNSLSAIPVRPHTNDVDVFFDTERPSKPYYKIKIVEVEGPLQVSADEMLKKLREKAKLEGMDAVIISDIGRQANTTLYSYQKLVGIGVKYKERIDYMHELLKEQEVSYWPDSIPDPKIFQMKYDMNGKNISLKDTFIRNFFYNEIYLFEDQLSVYGPADEWAFFTDTVINVFAKIYPSTNERLKASFKIKDYQLLNAVIKIWDEKKAGFVSYELERRYNAADVLMSKRLRKLRSKNYLWEEEISYNRNGLPGKIVRYKMEKGKRALYFEIQNTYYTVDDLPKTDN